MEKFNEQPRWLRFGLSAIVALVVLFAMVFEVSLPLPVFEQARPEVPVVSPFESYAVRERIAIDTAEDSYIYSGADLYVYSDGHSTQTAKIEGASGDVMLAGDLTIGAQTAISVTAGATITPTGTFQQLTSSGAVTCSTTICVANGATAGQLLILFNANAADVITIDGTGGTVECKADVALGAGDTLLLMWGGSDWYCLSGYDNS